ncbi:MAG TPA: AAA family ATPase [Nannocystaceae bacterium]|nr:AAA family ATPase [Nannocystaceae bacterium]
MDGPRPIARHGLPCSCDVIVELAGRDVVAALLREHGVEPGRIAPARAHVHAERDNEPGDWRQRLPAGAAKPGDLELLLAIVRTADCHGYRVLEAIGASCPELRRAVVERGSTRAMPRRASARTGARSPRTQERGPFPAVRGRSLERAVAPASPRRPRTIEPQPIATPIAEPRAIAPAPAPAPIVAPPEPARTLVSACDPGKLPKIFGRERELARLQDALARRSARTVALVGAAGSGRSTLARELASDRTRKVYPLSALDYGDEDEPALRSDLQAIAAVHGLALFDDLERVALETPPPWLPALTQAWLRDEPRVLPILGPESLARLQQWLPGVIEASDLVRIESLEGAPLGEAVTAGAGAVLAAHGVALAPDLRPAELARLADRYLVGLALPGRALDLLDVACARARRCGESTLTRARLHELVAELSGLPRARIEARGDQDAIELEQRIAEHVVGHARAIAALGELVRRNRAGFGGARPILGALLLGPSGVGKTELAKALARALFERDDALVRLDMSEYSEPHAVARIVGAPPGYVGHEHGGALTDPLMRRPHVVVLLDEIEKAHRDVHQLLLQVLDEGRLTDGRGRTVDFRHAAILMTSNLGAELATKHGSVARIDEAAVLARARAAFPVELWNRIEAPLVMQPLGRDELRRICRRLARASSERLQRERGVRYELSPAACDRLVERAGVDPSLGARPLRHLVTREIDPLVADAVLRGSVRAGQALVVDVDAGAFVLR